MSESTEGVDECDNFDDEEEEYPDIEARRGTIGLARVVEAYDQPASVSWRVDPQTSFSD